MMLLFLLFVAAFLIAGFLGGNYFYNIALNPRYDKGRALHALSPSKPEKDTEKPVSFFAEKPFADLWLTSFDGLRLHALCTEQPGGDWVLILHGYTAAACSMGDFARAFYNMGYNLLLPDARGHGQSEGDYIGMGWDERRDICAWVDGILQAHPDARILLFGISMGGATAMMTAGETLPSNVKGVVEDCGYSSVMDEFRFQLRTHFHMPAPVAGFVLFFANLMCRLRAGYFLSAASAVRQLEKSSLPMLFIHGEQDTYVPFFMLDLVYRAAPTPDKQKLPIPGANHGLASVVAPERYWDAVRTFAARVMG